MPQLQRQQKGEYPVRFTPRGTVDAFDATDKFLGACMELTDLVFDQSNPEVMVSRPGVGNGITSFAGFNTPGIVSVQVTVGSVTYGMIASAANVGKDEPFAYDHSTNLFLPIAGVAAANTPSTPAASGTWTPPVMASVGVNVIVTHPGFPGGVTKFGWFDITVPTAPVWNAGDTPTNGLTGTPTAVANFNNRAYFSFANRVEYTDVLTLVRTSAQQALVIGDVAPVTALSGLPLQTTSSGVVQALTVFKDFQIWQITGDPTSNDLALNYLSLTMGSSAPRSIALSPLGLYFASISGPMMVDQFGVVRPVTHSAQEMEPDIRTAWANALIPSRIAGGYTGSIYRVCIQTIILGANVTVDYWFDEKKRRWTGPHSFSYDCLSQFGTYFILVSNAASAKLFKSEITPSGTSSYADNGTAIMSTIKTSTFPKTGHMNMKQVVESTIELASASSAGSFAITAQDDLGNTLDTCSVSILPVGALWGSAVWGGFFWASATNIPTPYNVPWTVPLVFKKMALYITAAAAASVAIGTFFARFRDTGYTNNK